MCCNSGHNMEGPTPEHYEHIAKLRALEPRYKAVIVKLLSIGWPKPQNWELGAPASKEYHPNDIFCGGHDPEKLEQTLKKWELLLLKL